MDQTVSIIISTYKSKTLHHVLRALERQTSKQFEVIVCDDGSKDFKKLSVHSYPLRYVWHQDLGRHWSRTHNEGIALAQGEYTVFLHDDIIPDEHLVECVLEQMTPQRFISGIRHSIPRTSKAIKDPSSHMLSEDHRLARNPVIFNAFDHADINVLIPLEEYFQDSFNIVSGCLMAFPTKILREVGGAPEDYPGQGLEDYDIALRCMRAGLKLFMSFGMKGYHLDHPELRGSEVDKNITEFNKRVKNNNYKKNFNRFPLL